MTIELTEQMIRERTNGQSFAKGQEYYGAGAISNTRWQPLATGVLLSAECEGSSAPSYNLAVELDESGVRSAVCTCPYDWGGDCKHLVALLLTYLHQSEQFRVQKSVNELLIDHDRAALLALIERLVRNNPDLYAELERAVPAASVKTVTAAVPPAFVSRPKPVTQVSEENFRKQVKRTLKHNNYDEYDEYGGTPGFVTDLQEDRKTAQQLLDTGDAEGALIMLRVLLEMTVDDYDEDMDEEGDFAALIQSLGMPLAEAILSVDLDAEALETLQTALDEVLGSVYSSIEADLEVVSAALEYGWKELPDRQTQGDEYDEETWMVFADLETARLNVLERQGRTAEFLQLAQTADAYRYTLKLLEVGSIGEAVKASQQLDNEQQVLAIAQKLQQIGRPDEAIALAERRLNRAGAHSLELANWLAPLEEARGNTDMALLAHRAAFDAQPSITSYRHLKRLSQFGTNWDQLRPALVAKASESPMINTLVDIHLEEQKWDEAIAIAEERSWAYGQLEKVADAVIPYRTEWVIRTSLKQANALITTVQSKNYPTAAQWVGRAKAAYLAQGQVSEWQMYINNLRNTYTRRPALQAALKGL